MGSSLNVHTKMLNKQQRNKQPTNSKNKVWIERFALSDAKCVCVCVSCCILFLLFSMGMMMFWHYYCCHNKSTRQQQHPTLSSYKWAAHVSHRSVVQLRWNLVCFQVKTVAKIRNFADALYRSEYGMTSTIRIGNEREREHKSQVF